MAKLNFFEKLIPGSTTVYTRKETGYPVHRGVEFKAPKLKKAPKNKIQNSDPLSGYKDALKKGKLGGKGWGY